MFRPEDLDAYNGDVNDWRKKTLRDAAAEMNALGIVHRANSRSTVPARKALKATARKNAGMINRLTFRFPRHLVFVHKGVGRGTTIAQVGNTNRKAKPFLNPVIERNLPDLADIAGDHQRSLVVNALKIR